MSRSSLNDLASTAGSFESTSKYWTRIYQNSMLQERPECLGPSTMAADRSPIHFQLHAWSLEKEPERITPPSGARTIISGNLHCKQVSDLGPLYLPLPLPLRVFLCWIYTPL